MPRSLFNTVLCNSNDIAADGSKGFEVDGHRLFAVKKRGKLYVYHNRCPHVGLPLNWTPDQFLDTGKDLIQCTSHGARFRIDTGQCVAGPCPGQYLRAVKVKEMGGKVWLNSSDLD